MRSRNQYQSGDGARIVDIFRNALGLQEITINGVPTNTHFARVMVEADYHMKLIGIGLEKPPVKITSFIEKAKPTSVARNSLQRWFFQPNYDCVSISEDEMSMELVGSGVKLVGEDESVIGRRQSQTNWWHEWGQSSLLQFVYPHVRQDGRTFAALGRVAKPD